ncbi:hypothetical protein SMU102_09853 [Streptococcus mutans S1B]|nr:hypothetical protein SMU102_09853 [Streptococcus mutans S1B]
MQEGNLLKIHRKSSSIFVNIKMKSSSLDILKERDCWQRKLQIGKFIMNYNHILRKK